MMESERRVPCLVCAYDKFITGYSSLPGTFNEKNLSLPENLLPSKTATSYRIEIMSTILEYM